MTAPRIRLAQPTDVAELTNLEEMARRGIADERGGERLLEVTPARAEQWFVEGYVTLVALIDDVPVGFLSMRTGEISSIEGVFVHPGAREIGCGDALVDEARSIAKDAAAAVSKRSHCRVIVKRKTFTNEQRSPQRRSPLQLTSVTLPVRRTLFNKGREAFLGVFR